MWVSWHAEIDPDDRHTKEPWVITLICLTSTAAVIDLAFTLALIYLPQSRLEKYAMIIHPGMLAAEVVLLSSAAVLLSGARGAVDPLPVHDQSALFISASAASSLLAFAFSFTAVRMMLNRAALHSQRRVLSCAVYVSTSVRRMSATLLQTSARRWSNSMTIGRCGSALIDPAAFDPTILRFWVLSGRSFGSLRSRRQCSTSLDPASLDPASLDPTIQRFWGRLGRGVGSRCRRCSAPPDPISIEPSAAHLLLAAAARELERRRACAQNLDDQHNQDDQQYQDHQQYQEETERRFVAATQQNPDTQKDRDDQLYQEELERRFVAATQQHPDTQKIHEFNQGFNQEFNQGLDQEEGRGWRALSLFQQEAEGAGTRESLRAAPARPLSGSCLFSVVPVSVPNSSVVRFSYSEARAVLPLPQVLTFASTSRGTTRYNERMLVK